MRLKIFFAVVLVMCGAGSAVAQDPQFSQYYQAPLYLNPGFTGITQQQRGVINHRVQWPNLPQAFATFSASYDLFVEELRSGFGLLLTNDVMGTARWGTTTAGFLYSYKVRLTENLVFSPGLYFGYGTNGLDRTKLTLADGLEYGGISLDPEINRLGRQSYFDVGSGFLFYNSSVWLGMSFSHMNRPNMSILSDQDRLPMKTAVHGGFRLNLMGTGPGTASGRPSYLTPSFIYRVQGKSFSQLDLGVNYHVDPVSVGIWYRGKPFEKTVINTLAQDALIVHMGMYFHIFSIGYSYDFTISEMQTASGGAHEVSLVVEFVTKPMNRQMKRKYQMIPCPTFNNKPGFWKK